MRDKDTEKGRLKPIYDEASQISQNSGGRVLSVMHSMGYVKNVVGHTVTGVKNSAIKVGLKVFALGTVVTLILALLIGFMATVGGLWALDLYGVL